MSETIRLFDQALFVICVFGIMAGIWMFWHAGKTRLSRGPGVAMMMSGLIGCGILLLPPSDLRSALRVVIAALFALSGRYYRKSFDKSVKSGKFRPLDRIVIASPQPTGNEGTAET